MSGFSYNPLNIIYNVCVYVCVRCIHACRVSKLSSIFLSKMGRMGRRHTFLKGSNGNELVHIKPFMPQTGLRLPMSSSTVLGLQVCTCAPGLCDSEN